MTYDRHVVLSDTMPSRLGGTIPKHAQGTFGSYNLATLTEPIHVRTLLGKKGFETSLVCLRSVIEYSADPLRLVVHEDGSLTDAHRDALRGIDPQVEFVSRVLADEVVETLLEKHPRCLSARRSGLLFLKLFDITLLCPGPLAYVDSDVFFLRRNAGLFRQSADGRAKFMSDINHAYAVRPWRVWPVNSVRLAGLVNTGLIVGWRVGLDLDFLEWLLGRLAGDTAYARRAWWAEQTCWAALAARTECALFDPDSVILASTDMREYHPAVVAIHFVSTYRDRLALFLDRQRSRHESAIEVQLNQITRVSAAGLLWADFGRRLRTRPANL